jgi:hypothetical protein
VNLNGEVKKAAKKPRKPKAVNTPITLKTDDNNSIDTSEIIILGSYTSAAAAAAAAGPEQMKNAKKPRKAKANNPLMNKLLTDSRPGASSSNSLDDFQPAAKPKKAKAKAAIPVNPISPADRMPASAWTTAGTVSASRKRPTAAPFLCLPKLPKVANPLLANSSEKPKNPLLLQASQGHTPLSRPVPINQVAKPHSLKSVHGQLGKNSASAKAVQRLLASTPRMKKQPVPNFSPKESQVHQHVLDYQMQFQQKASPGFARPQLKGAVQPKTAAKQKMARANSLSSLATSNGAFLTPHVVLAKASLASLQKLPNGVTVTTSKGPAQLHGAKQPKQSKATKQSQNVRPSNMLNSSSSL